MLLCYSLHGLSSSGNNHMDESTFFVGNGYIKGETVPGQVANKAVILSLIEISQDELDEPPRG